MKILNNFDTQLKGKEFNEAVETHGNESVILITRSKFYWYIKGILLLIISLIIDILLISLLIFLFESGLIVLSWIILIFFIIKNIILLYYLLKIFIRYKMDFTIITKDGISTYKQDGIFININKNLPSNKIRTIQSKRDGLLGNIFGFGSISIITDGSLAQGDDNEIKSAGMIKLKYVDRPNHQKNRILELCLGEGKDVHFNINDYR